nr:DEAD/DEAH box helicase [Treponema sp.]
DENEKGKALIMVPTRELAVQVEEEAKKLTAQTSLKVFSFYGGVGYEKQTKALHDGIDILVGTPGRVIDLQEGGQMNLTTIKFLVVDEADRMFDMGFYPDLRTLIKVLPDAEKRQTMLFSATLNSYVKNLAWEYTRDPVEITIDADNVTVEDIDQELLHVSSDEKMKLLIGLLRHEKPESVLIFCNTKRMCEVLSKRLQINGFTSEFIIGDLPQSRRLRVLDDFANGKTPILVATDVAARGIDVADLAMVINYDLPNEAENYVHRIGRTARAGKTGKAYTFCSEQDVYSLPSIERYIEKQIPSRVADSSMFEEDASAGQYIRTENWHDGHDDENGKRNEDHRRHASHDGSRKRDGKYAKSADRHGRRRYHDADEPYDHNKRRDGVRHSVRNALPRDFSQLENLSFDERMKIYKERYADISLNSMSKNQDDTGRKTKKNGYKKNYRKNNYKNNKDFSTRSKKNSNSTQGVSQPAAKKVGIFAKLKAFFGGKK